MSQRSKKRDRTVRVEPPRAGQDLENTGEGGSEIVEDVLDDDASVSDGRHNKQTHRDSSSGQSSKKKSKAKAKIRKRDITIGTWNVRTMLPEGKLNLLLRELDDHEINITGLSETRWKGEGGVFNLGDHTIVFSGNEKGGSKGVAIVLDKYHGKCLTSHNSISDRIVMIKLNTKPVPL